MASGILRNIKKPPNSNFQFKNFPKKVLRKINSLNTPKKITSYIDNLNYNYSDSSLSPLDVLQENKAQCLQAALTASCLFNYHNHPPLLLDLRAVRDEDHVLCIYQVDGYWGSIAKSKFTGLRGRDPVYSSIKELALSYFENYFNFAGQKTLREYSIPLNLTQFDSKNWMTNTDVQSSIAIKLDLIKHYSLFSKSHTIYLSRVSGVRFTAGTMDSKIKNLSELNEIKK